VILRLGLYQILFLDRVPAYAAVDTSADLAHRFKRGAATGLVNAALRRAATDPSALTLPDQEADPVRACAVRWSHPEWLVERWKEELGDGDLESLLRAHQEAAPTDLRVNTLRTDRETLIGKLHGAGLSSVNATAHSPVGIRLDGPLQAAITAIPEGWSTTQSEASQLIAYLLAPRPAERVLDACAAPGGKATQLAALMRDRGEVLAVDVNPRGLAQVRRRSAELGISIVRTRRADARLLADESFDRVLVDAPCSGLGTLRGHPELRWRVRASDAHKFALLQADILRHVATLCAPGGILVYATCTLDRTENDEVIQNFCTEHPGFQLEDPRPDLPVSVRPLIDHNGFLRTFPHRHGLDGFFAARLRRR
jgi:16S rRNA (cytosine967-C5)-methyltransferase